MRILFTADPIIPVPPSGYGGIERIIDSLIRELRARGHAVALVALEDSTCPVDTLFAWPGVNVSSPMDTARNIVALSRAVRQFKPDLIHSFSRLAYLLAILPSRLPKVMSYQRHTSARQIRPALRLARGGSLRFTGCSQFICNQAKMTGATWTAVHNFVDLTKIDFSPAVAADAPLLFLSRIESIKGPALAIEIARRAGRRLLIAGNKPITGPELTYFEQKIAPYLGRDGIDWVGEIGDSRKNELLGQAAALIVPIQWEEPFGIVFAEALAAGTPVITCARGALPEIITPGITGFFINNVDDGLKAVEALPSLNRARCRAAAESRFSLSVCTDQYLEIYRSSVLPCG